MKSPPHMPQFGHAPIIGQRQQQMQAQIQAAIGQLSMGIYSQVATAYFRSWPRGEDQSVDQNQLRQLAQNSQVAARCYFESLGIIQPEKETP